MATISQRIKEGLQIRNMKQADIVEKTGINKGALSSYISGTYEPKQKNIHLIAKALCVDESWLMGNDVPMERTSIQSESLNDKVADLKLQKLLAYYNTLNNLGKDKAVERIKELTYIPNYVEQSDTYLNAAHERTDIEVTDEMKEHDDDIMNDDNF